jgi:hypothetical protein
MNDTITWYVPAYCPIADIIDASLLAQMSFLKAGQLLVPM